MTNAPRFAFFGTPALACDILDALSQAGYLPELVVTMPDRPQGRGLVLTPSPVAAWAAVRGIEVFKPEKLDGEFVATLAARSIPLAVVVAYGKIIPQPMLDSFSRGMWNIHYSLLPRFRGATPVESAILAGDAETGVVIQRMVFALDAGPIVALERTPIEPHETAPALRTRLNTMAARLLVQIFPQLVSGEVSLVEQNTTEVTRCGKMEKADGDISHDDDVLRWRKYRAFYAWPGTYFFAQRGERAIRVKIASARWGNGRFTIETVVPEGKGVMSYRDFLASGARSLL